MERFYYWEEGPTGKVHQLLRMDGYETKEELLRDAQSHLDSAKQSVETYKIKTVRRAWIMRAEEEETLFVEGET